MPLEKKVMTRLNFHRQLMSCCCWTCSADCFNVAIYHLYHETIFYSFAPCQSVASIHFEKHRKVAEVVYAWIKKQGSVVKICKNLVIKLSNYCLLKSEEAASQLPVQ